MDFHNFSCTTSQENAKVTGVKKICDTLVMLLPYRVEVSDTKVTHFTPILALCTCLHVHRSHLQKPVSMKQTKHSRKSEAQNLCSQCPPFTRTHVAYWSTIIQCHFRYYKQFHCLYPKNTAYNVRSQSQRSDSHMTYYEQLFPLSYWTGGTTWCWARPIRIRIT